LVTVRIAMSSYQLSVVSKRRRCQRSFFPLLLATNN
jgi:hypothetical protein